MTKYTVFGDPINDDGTLVEETTSVEVGVQGTNEDQNTSTSVEGEDNTLDTVKEETTGSELDKQETQEESEKIDEDTVAEKMKDERLVSEVTEDLTDDLKEIEDLINVEIEGTEEEGNSQTSDGDGSNRSKEGLEKALKTIKTLQSKLEKLELENAEYMKFGQDASLDPEIVILKHNYPKAKKGDQAALDKIKELIKRDLGLGLSNIAQTTLSDSIAGSLDTSEPKGALEGTMVF